MFTILTIKHEEQPTCFNSFSRSLTQRFYIIKELSPLNTRDDVISIVNMFLL